MPLSVGDVVDRTDFDCGSHGAMMRGNCPVVACRRGSAVYFVYVSRKHIPMKIRSFIDYMVDTVAGLPEPIPPAAPLNAVWVACSSPHQEYRMSVLPPGEAGRQRTITWKAPIVDV